MSQSPRGELAVSSPYVAMPGLLDARCVKEGPTHYLAVSANAARRGARPDGPPGDIVVGGRTWADWGLHLVDMNRVMGNLLEVVRRQSAAFLQGR